MQDVVWNVGLLQAASDSKVVLSIPWSRKRGGQALACLVPVGRWYLAMAQEDDDDVSDGRASDAYPTMSATAAGPQGAGNSAEATVGPQRVKLIVANPQHHSNVITNPQYHPNVVTHPQYHPNVITNPQYHSNVIIKDQHHQLTTDTSTKHHYRTKQQQSPQQHPVRSRLIVTNFQWSLCASAVDLTVPDIEGLPRLRGEWMDAVLLSCRSGFWGQ